MLELLSLPKKYGVALFNFYTLVEGMIGAIFYYGSLPLFFYKYQTSVIQYQQSLAIALLPWSAKPLIGVLSDRFPIKGYHKKWYAIFGALLLFPSILGTALSESAQAAIVFLSFVSFSIAVLNTMFDGQYATMILLKKAQSSLAPFVEGLTMLGAIAGVIVVGALADNENDAKNIVYGYGMCVFLAIPVCYSIFYDSNDVFYKDSTQGSSELSVKLNDSESDNYIKSKPNAKEIILSVCMALISLLLLFMLYNINDHNAASTFGVAFVTVIGLAIYVARVYSDKPRLAGLCVFALIHETLYVDIMGAMDVFYTAPDACIASGPDFDLLFYTSWTKILAHIFSLVLMLIYMKWATQWTTRTSVLFGITLRISSSVTDIIIAKHWNRSMGFSDKSFFLLGDAMISLPSSLWAQLALVIATTRLLIKGREALTMAVISGLQFTGQSVSKIFGLYLMQLYTISADMKTQNCNYDKYPQMLIAAHIVIPMFLYPAAYALL